MNTINLRPLPPKRETFYRLRTAAQRTFDGAARAYLWVRRWPVGVWVALLFVTVMVGTFAFVTASIERAHELEAAASVGAL